MTDRDLTRRSALEGAAVLVVGGIGGYAFTRARSPKPSDTARANAYGYGSGSSGTVLAAVDSIPAGGGIVLGSKNVVLTKTADGTVHAFSATCTHQGCTVDRVAAGTIDCPCHGSRFAVATGAVVSGPAPRPLPGVPVTVRDGQVYTA
jgi:Rieske Fe-S protein